MAVPLGKVIVYCTTENCHKLYFRLFFMLLFKKKEDRKMTKKTSGSGNGRAGREKK